MVGVTRFELVTSAMSTQRSNQLSYTPSAACKRWDWATYNALRLPLQAQLCTFPQKDRAAVSASGYAL